MVLVCVGVGGGAPRAARVGGGAHMEAQATAAVKEALAALYHHPDDATRTAADRWLQQFQHTLDAWQVWAPSPFPFLEPNRLDLAPVWGSLVVLVLMRFWLRSC